MAKTNRIKKSGIYAVLSFGRKFILIKKARGPFKGRWDLAGGKPEFGETAKETLEREVLEETGLRLRNAKLQSIITYVHNYESRRTKEEMYHMCIVYSAEAKSLKGLLDETDGQDSSGARVFTKREIEKLKLTPLAKKALINK